MDVFPVYSQFLHIAMSREKIADNQLYVTAQGWLLMSPPIADATGAEMAYNRAATNLGLQHGSGVRVFWFLKPISTVRTKRKQADGYKDPVDEPMLHAPFPGPYYSASRGTRRAALVSNIVVDDADAGVPIATGPLLLYRSHAHGRHGTTGLLVMG